MNLPKKTVHRTYNINQRAKSKEHKKFVIYNFFFLGFLTIILTSYFLAHPSSAYAQSCTPSCSSGYFCSLDVECCSCVNGNGPGEVGPVTCCAPPGPGSGSCSTYDVLGCLPDSDTEPDPSPSPDPIPPSTQGEPRPRPIPFPCDDIAPEDSIFGNEEQEHHSLRPYQSSPCNPEIEETALFCGNQLIVSDPTEITKTYFPSTYHWEGSAIEPNECINNFDGTETCTFTIDRTRDITVDLSRADLPIMGYTEPSVNNESRIKQVVNSNVQPDPETVLNAEKVNEYVSWYLNGVNERAEYRYLDVDKECIGETTRKPGLCQLTFPNVPLVGKCFQSLIPPISNPFLVADGQSSCGGYTEQCCVNPLIEPLEEGEILDRDKLINYSGPIKKSLPISIQHRIRIDEVDDAFASRNNEPVDSRYQFPTNDENQRHDQVVGCTFGLPIKILGVDFGQVGGIPVPCYADDLFSKAADFLHLKKRNRLSEWHPNNENKFPPLEEDYPTFRQYLAEYKRWRGESCIVAEIPPELPLIGKLPIIGGTGFIYCYNNPLNPDYWAELWPYIPFSSTENRKGSVEISTLGAQPVQPNVTLLDVAFTNQQPAELFFAHMQESAELADILQGTYVPKDEERVGPISGVAPAEIPFCDLAQIRTNPGDDLFAGEISGTLEYTAEVNCDFLVSGDGNLCREITLGQAGCVPNDFQCNTSYGPFDCPLGQICGVSCSSPPTSTLCDGITAGAGNCVPDSWSCNTNYGSGYGCPSGYKCGISCSGIQDALDAIDRCEVTINVSMDLITNTPKADEVWSRTVAGTGGVFKRISPKIDPVDPSSPIGCLLDIPAATQVSYSGNATVLAGNPGNQRPGAAAELYFPHIGGVYEYFLKGIQTFLRPKGYGEQISYAGPGDPLCTTDKPTDICPNDCNPNPTDVVLDGVKEEFTDLSSRWTGPRIGGARIEKYDQVINSSLARGVNPVFTLAVWLHETAGSNYELICSRGANRSQDFGINISNLETVVDCNSGEIIEDHFDDQLQRFLNLPGFYLSACDISTVNCPMEIFGSMFTKSGNCTPSGSSNATVADLMKIYEWLAPGQTFPCYPIAVP